MSERAGAATRGALRVRDRVLPWGVRTYLMGIVNVSPDSFSGDGMANIGPPPQEIRDRLVAQGITINGLAILKREPWLDGYYNDNVVGGPGGFLMEVEDFPSFIAAMQHPLP